MDGKYYIKLCEKGQFLHNKSNISLIFNTDGAPLYSSSSVSLWPVFLAVNELPSPDRFVYYPGDSVSRLFTSIKLIVDLNKSMAVLYFKQCAIQMHLSLTLSDILYIHFQVFQTKYAYVGNLAGQRKTTI